MDSRQYEQTIEQLQVTLEGTKGLLNEVVTLTNLFIPLLEQIPQSDKKVLMSLKQRIQVASMMLAMDRQGPPTIVQSSF